MKRAALSILSVAVLASVAACARYESRARPVSMDPVPGAGPSSMEPQPPNSLPLGSAVDAPLTPPAGDIATTRVGPASTPAAPTRRGAPR